MKARVVFPHHGVHQKIMDGIVQFAMKDLIFSKIFSCPTMSSIFSGRRKNAKGSLFILDLLCDK